jgi:hypothetical protein
MVAEDLGDPSVNYFRHKHWLLFRTTHWPASLYEACFVCSLLVIKHTAVLLRREMKQELIDDN